MMIGAGELCAGCQVLWSLVFGLVIPVSPFVLIVASRPASLDAGLWAMQTGGCDMAAGRRCFGAAPSQDSGGSFCNILRRQGRLCAVR